MMESEFPKCPICGYAGKYELGGIMSRYAKCPRCMAKWRYSERTRMLTLHELPKNGEALRRVESMNVPLFSLLGKPLDAKSWKTLKLDGETDWKFLHEYISKDITPNVSDCVVKEKDEVVLQNWHGEHMANLLKLVDGKRVVVGKKAIDGVLLLTDRRTIFLRKTREGSSNKLAMYQVLFETPLETIKGISGESANGDEFDYGSLKETVINANNIEQRYRLTRASIELVKPLIENAINARKEQIDSERKKEKIHVMLDFSFLRTYMEKGGLLLQTVKCPHCNAPISLPKSGNTTTCEHCGREIFAQDIYDIIKKLI